MINELKKSGILLGYVGIMIAFFVPSIILKIVGSISRETIGMVVLLETVLLLVIVLRWNKRSKKIEINKRGER